MAKKKTQPAQLTDEQKRRAFDAAFREMVAKLGLDPNLLEKKIRFGSHSELSGEEQQKLAMIKGIQFASKSARDELTADIHTQEDLDNALQGFCAVGDRAPTLARECLDQIRPQLRRRGGPGRDPLLNDQEAEIVCDRILKFIGEGLSETEAISETSKLCRELLGKAVGARTIRTKAWNRRSEFSQKIDQKKVK